MSAAYAALRGRLAAEALHTDACTVHRPGAPVTDPETGVVVPTLTLVYTGKCKVQSATAQAASPVAGGHVFTVESLRLDFPVSSALRTGDVATIAASAMDPDLIGLTFRLVELARGTNRTADRWNVELVTA